MKRRAYDEPWDVFANHETVKHSAKEYVRGDVTTNSVEGYFSIFKRGMKRRISALQREAFAPLSGGI